jgi:predicted dehydrogenase
MRFLIAGLGSIGRRHLRHLVELGQEDIVLFRTHHGTMRDEGFADYLVETDLQVALAHKPDAVIISNPTALHLDVAIPAAKAGCHLLVEKPVSHNMDRLDELQAAADASGSRILVGFQFRYHPGLRKIAAILESNQIGRPLSFRTHWGEYLPGWHPWEDYRKGYSARKDLGGGVILTLTHSLDYIHWLLGEISSVWAFRERLSDLGLEVEDTAEIGLRFANGVFGSVHLNYTQRPPRHQLEIVCSEGTINWDSAANRLKVYSASEERWQYYPLPEGFERDDLFRAQMEHFLKVTAGAEAPVCNLKDGITALKLALAAHQSAQEERLVRM